jgi:hypothetical protein
MKTTLRSVVALAIAALFAATIAFGQEGTKQEPAPESKQARCCTNAEKAGNACAHPCCVEAAKLGNQCTKCGGSGPLPAKKTEKK